MTIRPAGLIAGDLAARGVTESLATPTTGRDGAVARMTNPIHATAYGAGERARRVPPAMGAGRRLWASEPEG